MAEWLIERGIGESRALLVAGDKVLAAKMRWPGELHAGRIIPARLVHKNGSRGTARTDGGADILLDRLPRDANEGATYPVLITRAAMAERGRFKRAQGRIAAIGSDAEPDIFETGTQVHRFPAGLWEDVWDTTSSGEVSFAGGSLLFSVTPAITVVDVDGDLPPRELALAAVPPLAIAIRQFDLGGSIGIDFPTIESKADRKALDAAIESALADWPHERTAVNGFGFVHIVARLQGPSLLHRMAMSRIGAAARMALRRAQHISEPGALLLTVHPAVKAKLKAEWLEELSRSTGRQVRIEADPSLAIEGGFAQAVPL